MSTAGTRDILVVGEVRTGKVHDSTLELTAKARSLADVTGEKVVTLLMVGELDLSCDALGGYGADVVIRAKDKRLDVFNQEIQARIVEKIIRDINPAIVLSPATTAGRTVMPAVAAGLGTGLTADCTGLEIDGETGQLLQTRPAIGGNVMATIRTPDHRPQIATVRPKTFPVPAPDPSRCVEIRNVHLPAGVFQSRIEPLGFEKSGEKDGNIQDREVVVSGGKGMKKPENFAMLHELASLLDGGVGASRAAVDNRWIGYPHQVGLSGKVVSPKVYMAVGISGAVQHLAGMQTADFIVAINKDPEAPIFRVADLGLCGDLFDILPRLVEALKARKGGYGA
ncbi:MAG: electron transfer flavoprotein subunit alpha/FixB family protein [Thermovirgaceae bacterium]